ncbi:hypothetical protein [Fusobacterium necrophorum]
MGATKRCVSLLYKNAEKHIHLQNIVLSVL